MCMLIRILTSICLLVVISSASAQADDQLVADARSAMRRAATYYREQVSSHGGYVYHYSIDLSKRWGEGEATADQIWVQPPGTPTVGMAFLKAYAATSDRYYLDAAIAAGEALTYGQITTGGWTNCIDFNPRGKRVALYRNGQGRGRNISSLDDGQTQSAIQFLIHLDDVLDFDNENLHLTTMFALDALMAAQFPNGAFPQVWRGPIPEQPVRSASYPSYDWRTEGRIKNYWDMYTLNDNVAGYVADVLIDAHHTYEDPRYLAALKRLGDFLILAQMPEPQPGWAQQYDYEMHPIWARKFEPPAISGDETQEVIATLMNIFVETGDERYLLPIPKALTYLKRSLLSNGQLARYYELKTNRPLYMNRDGKTYSLTYDDSNLPDHYGWKVDARIADLEQRYQILSGLKGVVRPTRVAPHREREQLVRQIIRDLDDQGRWVSSFTGERLVGQLKLPIGTPYLSSDVFSRNLTTLAEYVSSTSE